MNLNTIEKEALNLEIDERARLASLLLESLEDISEEESEQLWAREALRRSAEWDAGEVQGIPYDQAIAEAKSLIE